MNFHTNSYSFGHRFFKRMGGANPEDKNVFWDYVQNPQSEIRQFMHDDVFFADPDSKNQKAVMNCMPNLATYMQTKNASIATNNK